MKNFWTQIKRPFLALAPMAGITDQPFRLICKKFGANILYSEMISSEALFHNANLRTKELKNERTKNQLEKTLKLIQFSGVEKPYLVQIFGADPEHMAFAAEYVASGEWKNDFNKISKSKYQMSNQVRSSNIKCQNQKFDIGNWKFDIVSIPSGIDINMGCPAKDVVKTGAGAALLKNPRLAEKIIIAIKKKVKNIPISVKTRIGWSDNKHIPTFCRMLECCGVEAIAIHGRTVKQGFSGEVDWETIYKVKKTLKIPVIGNGGINMNNELRIMNYAEKLDEIMIGSGALGKPWIFRNLKSQIGCHSEVKPKNPSRMRVSETMDSTSSPHGSEILRFTQDDIKKIVLEHAKLVEKLKGQRGIIEFRKHLGWYFRETPHAKKIRRQMTNVDSLREVKNILSQI